MSSRLVVFGLGNPGPDYAATRHNLGFRVVDRLALDRRAARWRSGRSYVTAAVAVGGTRVDLVKPKTFMNLSGKAVGEWVERGSSGLDEILVVVDDTAIPLGRLRLRRGGSDGGHNGLKSVIAELGTNGFARLRLGIGPVPPGADPADFVLGRFAAEEAETVETMVGRAARCIEMVVGRGIDAAMGEFNAEAADRSEDEPTRGKRVDPAGDV